MTKILITGANGYIGSKLLKYLEENKFEVHPFSHKKNDNGFTTDLAVVKEIESVITREKPDIIIHTAWINSLVQCEQDKETADTINVQWSKNLIKAIESVNNAIKFVFLSSDYVFEGNKGNYLEEDICKPSTYYGQNKAEVEDFLRASSLPHLICRTANVFCNGGKFFTFLYEKLQKNEPVDVFYDSFYTPTYMQYFVESLCLLLQKDITGTYHLAGSERVSRYNFAFRLAAAMAKDERLILPTRIPEGNLIAHDVSLDSSKARQLLNNFCPNIDQSLQFLLGKYLYPYFTHFDKRGGIRGIIQSDQTWEEINYIEGVQWAVRGGHYHKNTTEGFFIIDGKIKVEIQKRGEREKSTFIANKGDAFVIEPHHLHTFSIIENARWINFLTKSMQGDIKDFFTE